MTGPAEGAPASGDAPRRSAIVVGAGFAGLAAALRLREHGFAVTVLEREAAPGGRARSVALAGVELDPCAMLVSTSDRALLHLLGAIGQRDALEPWPETSLRAVRATGTTGATGRPGTLHPLDAARPRLRGSTTPVGLCSALRCARLDRLVVRYTEHLDPAAPERAFVLDDRSAGEWARLYFGDQVRSAWVAPWLTAWSYGDDAETSRLLFLLQHVTMRAGAAAGLRFGPGALAEALARRVSTRCGVDVTAVERANGGFSVRGRSAGRDERFEADAVVLALPPAAMLAAASAVLTTAEKDHLATARMQPALSAVFVTRSGADLAPRRVIDAAPAGVLQAFASEGGRAQPLAGRRFVAIASAAFAREAVEYADETILRRLAASAERLSPGALRELEASRIVRHPVGYARFDVGRFRALARLRRVEASQLAAGRRLTLAGDHLAGPRLEDAVASGLRAADALAAAG